MQIFYFVGFGLFCLESLLSLWVIQVRENKLAGFHPYKSIQLSVDADNQIDYLSTKCKDLILNQFVYNEHDIEYEGVALFEVKLAERWLTDSCLLVTLV